MEKIYMEESKKQRKSVVDFSVVLSFGVAIFAIFSLAMFGIVSNQGTGVSYAAVTSDTFTLKDTPVFVYNNSSRQYNANFELYFANTLDDYNNIVFCVERAKDIVSDSSYTKTTTARTDKSDVIADQGLLYLLGLGSTEAKLDALTDYDKKVDAVTLQWAIWLYLSEKYSDDVYQLRKNVSTGNSLDDATVMNSDTVYLGFDSSDPTQISAYTGLTGANGKIKKLVEEAKAAKIPTVTVNVSDEQLAKTDDGAYYQSGAISVVGDPSSNFESYEVTYDTSIEGLVTVGEDGKEVDTKNMEVGKKFYIRIPADKVTKETQTIKLNAKGKFNGQTGFYYATSDENLQRMASTEPGYVSGGAELAVVGNTGMNTAQTIYFIGLIVLLCGVGIVYANAKPVESKQ